MQDIPRNKSAPEDLFSNSEKTWKSYVKFLGYFQ